MSAELFAQRLRELREAAGLSQQELAVAAGMSVTGLSMLEQGKRSPNWTTVVALADILKVSVQEFREPGGESEKPKPGRPRRRKSNDE